MTMTLYARLKDAWDEAEEQADEGEGETLDWVGADWDLWAGTVNIRGQDRNVVWVSNPEGLSVNIFEDTNLDDLSGTRFDIVARFCELFDI